jgi:hypothetical protein
MLDKTVKTYGGSISNTTGLRHILSVGYEVECGNLMKLTKLESDKLILFNSDRNLTNSDFGNESTSDSNTNNNIIAGSQELIEMDVFGESDKVDENIEFSITNDIALYPLAKKLKKICYYPSEDTIKSSTKSKGKSEKDHSAEKNELYLFRDTGSKKEYKIHFMFKTPRECHEHSNVEWIFTYFKPKRQNNVIVNTFLNMIKNLVKHTEDLVPIKGNLIMKYKDADNKQQEIIIDKPEEKTLYHKPGTNLYYLQTQVTDHPFTMDGTCAKIQMTFSTHIENLFTVLKTILTDKKKAIPSIAENLKIRLDKIELVKNCTDELIEKYNKSEAIHKLVLSYKKSPDLEIIKNYIFLILFKIESYYTFKKGSEKQTKYLKNLLFINSRHSNYDLYVELKKHIEKMLKVDGPTAVSIIKKIIFQPETLYKMISTNIKDKLRKGIFLESNVLEKTNSHYGDPIYSLVSYFDFFEQPIQAESNIDESLIDYDWLDYTNVDKASAKMDLKDGIVLVELRNFQAIISSYVYSIADDELKEQMKNGACNILTKHYSEDVPSLSIGNFKKIIQIMKKKSSKKTLKITSSK